MNFRIIGYILTGFLGCAALGQALTIDGNPPVMTIVNPDAKSNPFITEFTANLNATLATTFENTLDTARNNLKGFKQQKDLAQGFANANAYSSNSATLQGFQNYSLFAVACGLMLGVQAPSSNLSYYSKIADDINEKGDFYGGIGLGLTYLNVGINAGTILPGLYVNAKYGGQKIDFKGFGMDFKAYGLGFNYRFLETKSLIGLVKWRGLSLGSGVYMQSDKIKMSIKADTIQNAIPFGDKLLAEGNTPSDSAARTLFLEQLGFSSDPAIGLVPSFKMGLDVSTITIPFDAVTAVSLLWGVFNITAGAGFDLNFGTNKIILEGTADATIKTDTTKAKFAPAKVTIDGSSSNGPTFARFRVMTGLGLGLGPVKLDIPLIYYPASGMAVGLTAAVVW